MYVNVYEYEYVYVSESVYVYTDVHIEESKVSPRGGNRLIIVSILVLTYICIYMYRSPLPQNSVLTHGGKELLKISDKEMLK
jgi:hypothetical protein